MVFSVWKLITIIICTNCVCRYKTPAERAAAGNANQTGLVHYNPYFYEKVCNSINPINMRTNQNQMTLIL